MPFQSVLRGALQLALSVFALCAYLFAAFYVVASDGSLAASPVILLGALVVLAAYLPLNAVSPLSREAWNPITGWPRFCAHALSVLCVVLVTAAVAWINLKLGAVDLMLLLVLPATTALTYGAWSTARRSKARLLAEMVGSQA